MVTYCESEADDGLELELKLELHWIEVRRSPSSSSVVGAGVEAVPWGEAVRGAQVHPQAQPPQTHGLLYVQVVLECNTVVSSSTDFAMTATYAWDSRSH